MVLYLMMFDDFFLCILKETFEYSGSILKFVQTSNNNFFKIHLLQARIHTI
jgi:hypothetical protein